MTGDLIIAPSPDLQPAFFTPTPKAAKRVLEFFTAQISNDHTRRAYMNAARRFADWCADKNIDVLERVAPFHVAAFIKDLQDELSPPSVKQHLAALRMLFDWLVTGLSYGPASRQSGRHRDEYWQSHVSRHGHHRLFKEQRQAGSGAAHCQP
jgi:site-specific recombinase XerD